MLFKNTLQQLKRKALTSAAIVAISSVSATSNAIDVDAGDYVPAAPGTNVALLYLQHAQRDSLYSGGNKLSGNNGLDSNVGIFRYVHFTEMAGMTVDPQFLIPFGELEGQDDMSVLGDTSGIGDPILAATFWVQNNIETKTYTGITPYIYVPIGSYDNNDPLNLGENRWKYNLQAAHVRPLTDKITMDLVGDVMLFGENDDFGAESQTLKQEPLFQAQAWFRYQLSDTSDLRLLVSKTFGGETEVDGIDQNDRTSTSKIGVGGSFFIGNRTQVITMFGRDLSVENGFKEETRLNIRIMYVL